MFTYEVDEEISLKLIDEGDAEAVFKLTDQSRDYLREWLPWIDMTTEIGDTRNFIKASKKMYAESKGLNTVILYNGEAAGIVGYNEVDWQNKIAYIGYWLGEGFQGKGIMTRATKALVDYALEQLNLHKVDIRAAEEIIKVAPFQNVSDFNRKEKSVRVSCCTGSMSTMSYTGC